MKKVEACIDPSRLSELRARLEDEGIVALSVRTQRSVGKGPTWRASYRGAVYESDEAAEVEVVFVVDDEQLPGVIAALEWHGCNGAIMVTALDRVIRVSRPRSRLPSSGVPDWSADTVNQERQPEGDAGAAAIAPSLPEPAW